jgi:hypothetical protein
MRSIILNVSNVVIKGTNVDATYKIKWQRYFGFLIGS